MARITGVAASPVVISRSHDFAVTEILSRQASNAARRGREQNVHSSARSRVRLVSELRRGEQCRGPRLVSSGSSA